VKDSIPLFTIAEKLKCVPEKAVILLAGRCLIENFKSLSWHAYLVEGVCVRQGELQL